MQEIKKRRIVIASILKPVDDTRMHEKIGTSLSGVYDVHIIGFPSPGHPAKPSTTTFHPLDSFRRISVGRLLASYHVLIKAISLKPSMLIICTHELLTMAFVTRVITGCRVIYDVQENYAFNIRYGKTVPVLLRPLLAFLIKFKQRLLAPVVTHFFLAEQSYARELNFIDNRYTVLENKLKGNPQKSRYRTRNEEDKIRLLFSGTVAETTGIFIAIALAEKLHEVDSRVHLCIIGYAIQDSVRIKVRKAIRDKPFIEAVGLDSLVGHAEILSKIEHSDFGIVSYPPNASTDSSLPTKLFEYLGYQLPILLINNKMWTSYCAPYKAAITFDPQSTDAADIYTQMFNTTFYGKIPGEVFWETEERKLLKIVDGVMLNYEL